MKVTKTERDAQEFGLHVKQGGWRLGLLVARNVEKGKGEGRYGDNRNDRYGKNKVSAQEFGRLSGTSAPRVLRYLKAWEAAATDGFVPAAADLKPGIEPDIDVEKLPPWAEFYDASNAGGRPRDTGKENAKKILRKLPPKEQAEVIKGVVDDADADPGMVGEVYNSAKMIHHNGHVSEAEKKSGKAHMEKKVLGPMRKALGSMTSLSVISSLREAASDLDEMISDGELSPETFAKILDAHEEWCTKLEIARAMFNMDDDIEEMTR